MTRASGRRYFSGSTILLGGILLAGSVDRFWGLSFGLPNTDVRPDETTLVVVALGLLFGGLNPRFFHWPSFEFYLLAVPYRIAWEVGHWRGFFHHKYEILAAAAANPTPYLLAPRVLSAVAGIATIWFVYRVTLKLVDRTTALVAAFFLAVAFLHVRDSHFGVTDVPMACLAMATMIPLSRAFLDPSGRRNWIAGGILTGLAASTKYNGGITVAVGVAIAVMALIDMRGSGDSSRSSAVLRGLTRFLTAAALAFVAGTPFAVLDFPRFVEGLQFDQTHLMTGHGIMLERGWIYHLLFSLRYGLGAPLLVASVLGVLALAARSWRTAVLVCTFPLLYYVVVGRGYTVFVRYMTPIVPFLCITAAVAVVETVRRVTRSWQTASPALVGAAAFLVAVPSIQRTVAFDSLMAKTDTRLLARAWLDTERQSSDWIAEEPPEMVHPAFTRTPALLIARFDLARHVFVSEKGETVTPEWIVLCDSPLALYTSIPADILPIVAREYTLAATFGATSGPESPLIFDQQDKFFVPFADFSRRVRPGPEIRIYRRRGDTSR